jgi:NDP-sugar pyrophosphorylase family protein
MYTTAILAGGLATRLRPITEKIPKALVPVGGEPFIFQQLKLLKNKGIENVVLCAWYKGEMVRDEVGSGSQFGMKVEYSFDGDQPLGTAGAIRKALPLLGESFFVLYGDSYLPCNYQAIQTSFVEQALPGLMTVYENTLELDRSNVEFRNGKIKRYVKGCQDPGPTYIDYGLGVFNAEAFSEVPLDRNTDLVSVYQGLLLNHQLAAFETHERYYEIGSLKGLQELDRLLNQNPNFAYGEHS